MRRNLTTRRACIGGGLAAILAARHAPAALLNLRGGMTIGGASLPYKARLEYLESTGTQYIDTGVTPDINGVSTLKMEPTVTMPVPWGCINFTETSGYGRYFRSSGVGGSAYREANTYYEVVIDGINKKYIYNGVESPFSGEFFKEAANGSCWLFGRSDNGALGEVRIYGASFTDANGIMLRSIIPVLDHDDTPCMYDEVTGAFFYNAGTGSFTAAPEVGGSN